MLVDISDMVRAGSVGSVMSICHLVGVTEPLGNGGKGCSGLDVERRKCVSHRVGSYPFESAIADVLLKWAPRVIPIKTPPTINIRPQHERLSHSIGSQKVSKRFSIVNYAAPLVLGCVCQACGDFDESRRSEPFGARLDDLGATHSQIKPAHQVESEIFAVTLGNESVALLSGAKGYAIGAWSPRNLDSRKGTVGQALIADQPGEQSSQPLEIGRGAACGATGHRNTPGLDVLRLNISGERVTRPLDELLDGGLGRLHGSRSHRTSSGPRSQVAVELARKPPIGQPELALGFDLEGQGDGLTKHSRAQSNSSGPNPVNLRRLIVVVLPFFLQSGDFHVLSVYQISISGLTFGGHFQCKMNVISGENKVLMEPEAGIEPATYSLRVNWFAGARAHFWGSDRPKSGSRSPAKNVLPRRSFALTQNYSAV